MMKNKQKPKNLFILSLLAVLIVGAIGGTAYFVYLMSTRVDDTLKVDLKEQESGSIRFDLVNFYPGCSKEQKVEITTNIESSKLGIEFDFLEEQALLPYFGFKLTQETTVLYNGALKDVDIKPITFDNKALFIFEFSMADDVNNDAQGKALDMAITFVLNGEE